MKSVNLQEPFFFTCDIIKPLENQPNQLPTEMVLRVTFILFGAFKLLGLFIIIVSAEGGKERKKVIKTSTRVYIIIVNLIDLQIQINLIVKKFKFIKIVFEIHYNIDKHDEKWQPVALNKDNMPFIPKVILKKCYFFIQLTYEI